MAALTIELPPHAAQTAFNLRRWSELQSDAELAKFEGRVETDRHGHIIMSPPPAPSHPGRTRRGVVDDSLICAEFPKRIELPEV